MTNAVGNPPAFVGRDHVWRQLRVGADSNQRRPILFLDRDGVIVEEVNYLHRIADVAFLDGIAETVVVALRAGWRVAMVSNQAGIGRGYYGWEEFAAVNRFVLDRLDSYGAVIDAVLAVPHHPEGGIPYAHPDHPMRKPNPGMLVAAAELLGGDLANSLIVGDSVADLLAGKRAGLRQGFQVLTGHGTRYRVESEALAAPDFAVHVIGGPGDAKLREMIASGAVNIADIVQ